MKDGKLERARSIYLELVASPRGLTAEQLCQHLNCEERDIRAAMEILRPLAAENPRKDGTVAVAGFDPHINRYVIAQDAEQSERVILNYFERARSIIRGVTAQIAAHQKTFGAPAPKATQPELFALSEARAAMQWEK